MKNKPVLLRGSLLVMVICLGLGGVAFWQNTNATAAAPSAPPLLDGVIKRLAVPGNAQLVENTTQYLPLLVQRYPRTNSSFGIELHSVTATPNERVDLVVSSGTRFIRRNGLLWMNIEATEGVYDWNSTYAKYWDTDLLAARKQGLEPILVIRSTPAWARYPEYADQPCSPIRADKYAAFGNFMHELVKHYSGHPYYIRYFQIGNEPEAGVNHVPADSPYGCWGIDGKPYFNGEAYGDMLSVVYPRIKEAHPQAQVVFGGLLLDCNPAAKPDCYGDPLKFFEGALYRHGNNDGKNYFDIVAYHGYDFYYGALGRYKHIGWDSSWDKTGPVLIRKMQYIESVLSKYGASDKRVINSEGGLICTSDKPENCQSEEWELTKAYYVPQYFVVSKALGLETAIWYSMLGWRGTNLVNKDGSPTHAFDTYAYAVSQLSSAVFQREIKINDSVFIYEFHDGNRLIWFAWSKNGAANTVMLPAQPKSIRDVFGQEQAITGTSVNITLKPLYIEW